MGNGDRSDAHVFAHDDGPRALVDNDLGYHIRGNTDVLDQCHQLGILMRPGAEPELDRLAQELPVLPSMTRFFKAPLIEISGTDIRRRVRQAEAYQFMVLPRVAEQINKLELYR